MAAKGTITIYLSSPGDVAEERRIVAETVERLRYEPAVRDQVELRLASWDNPAAPTALTASEPAQQSINRRLGHPSDYEIVVAILWSRLGTPVRIDHDAGSGLAMSTESGTAWELDDALRAAVEKSPGPDVLVYRKNAPATVALGDPDWNDRRDQFEALEDFISTLENSLSEQALGVVQSFVSGDEFRDKLASDLREVVFSRIASGQITRNNPPTPSLSLSELPYPGLVPFTSTDLNVFFGRETEVNELTSRVEQRRLVVVTGASGSGKSSSVGAGLIPRLQREQAFGGVRWLTPHYEVSGQRWVGPMLTPSAGGLDAVRALKRGLREIQLGDVAAIPPSGDPVSLATLCQQVTADPDARLLVVVDQFEECFTVLDDKSRNKFVESIVSMAQVDAISVVLVIRADFLARLVEEEGLAALVRKATWPLGPPDLAAVEEMINKPAEIAGLTFDRSLPQRILMDARREPGRLPLLAFTLNELHRRRRGDRLTTEAYDAVGGVEGAIGRLAERCYQSGDPDVQATFSDVFRRLVELDEVGGPVRARALLADFPHGTAGRKLVNSLINARILVVATEPGESPTVEVSHEAIFRSWPRLTDWIDTNHSDMRSLGQMRRAVSEWQSSGRSPTFLWPQQRIDQAVESVKRLEAVLSALEQEFLRSENLRLVDELTRPSTSHRRRRAISARLNVLSDNRPGVGLDQDGLPDVQWIHVPPSPSSSSPLWVAKYPTTAAQFFAFRRNSQQRIGGPDQAPTSDEQLNLPASCSWHEAMAFCRWLDGKIEAHSGEVGEYVIRLPSEVEWIRAATAMDSSDYPWGDDWEDHRANTLTTQLREVVGVGCYPAGDTDSGVSDLIGNVWEWCTDVDTQQPDRTDLRLLKGGSALESPQNSTVGTRRYMRSDTVRPDRGFRIFRSTPIAPDR